MKKFYKGVMLVIIVSVILVGILQTSNGCIASDEEKPDLPDGIVEIAG